MTGTIRGTTRLRASASRRESRKRRRLTRRGASSKAVSSTRRSLHSRSVEPGSPLRPKVIEGRRSSTATAADAVARIEESMIVYGGGAGAGAIHQKAWMWGLESASVRRDHSPANPRSCARREKSCWLSRRATDAFEHVRGASHDRDAHRRIPRLLGEQQAPPAASNHDAQDAVEIGAAPCCQQLRYLALQLRPKDLRQAQVRRGALQAVEVVDEGERRAVVDANHLEHPVAAQQPLVGGRDGHLAGRADAPVERSQLCGEGLVHMGRVGIEPTTLRLRVSCSAN